jgi:predicted MFS family arabinose efflux permease
MDLLGFALFSGAVIQLLLALQWAGFKYPWRSSVVIGLMVGFGVTLVAFIGWQLHKGDTASLPPRLFKKRAVCLGMFVAFFGNGGFFLILYYLQIWFQTVKGASPLKGGIMYLPTVGADITGAVLSGALGKFSTNHLGALLTLSSLEGAVLQPVLAVWACKSCDRGRIGLNFSD